MELLHGFGMGQGRLLPVLNILCFLPSKNGLKGCVYGQVAGEDYGALEEGGGQPDLPLLATSLVGSVWLPGHSRSEAHPLCLGHTPELWPSPHLDPAPEPIGCQVIPVSSSPCATVQVSVGPMARDVESLALCLRALLCEDMFRLDPTVPPLPFREEVSRQVEVGWAKV